MRHTLSKAQLSDFVILYTNVQFIVILIHSCSIYAVSKELKGDLNEPYYTYYITRWKSSLSGFNRVQASASDLQSQKVVAVQPEKYAVTTFWICAAVIFL